MRHNFFVGALVALAFLACTISEASAQVSDWSKQINDPSRFLVLPAFGNNAVLDKETRLVWQRAPSASLAGWSNANAFCNFLLLGGRFGWRLPTIQELASLIRSSS